MELLARTPHVPCLSCNYDLYGCCEFKECPECGHPVRLSLDAKRLYFTKSRFLRVLLSSLAIGLLYHLAILIYMFVILVLHPSPSVQFVAGSLVNMVGATALVVLCIAYALGSAGIIRRCLSIGFGAFGFGIAVLVLLGDLQVLGEMSEYDDDFAELSWNLAFQVSIPDWLTRTAFIGCTCAFFFITATFMQRIPNKRCSLALSLTAASVFLAAATILGLPSEFSGTPVALVPFALLIVSFFSSFCSLGFALRATYGVLSFNNSFSPGKGAMRAR